MQTETRGPRIALTALSLKSSCMSLVRPFKSTQFRDADSRNRARQDELHARRRKTAESIRALVRLTSQNDESESDGSRSHQQRKRRHNRQHQLIDWRHLLCTHFPFNMHTVPFSLSECLMMPRPLGSRMLLCISRVAQSSRKSDITTFPGGVSSLRCRRTGTILYQFLSPLNVLFAVVEKCRHRSHQHLLSESTRDMIRTCLGDDESIKLSDHVFIFDCIAQLKDLPNASSTISSESRFVSSCVVMDCLCWNGQSVAEQSADMRLYSLHARMRPLLDLVYRGWGNWMDILKSSRRRQSSLSSMSDDTLNSSGPATVLPVDSCWSSNPKFATLFLSPCTSASLDTLFTLPPNFTFQALWSIDDSFVDLERDGTIIVRKDALFDGSLIASTPSVDESSVHHSVFHHRSVSNSKHWFPASCCIGVAASGHMPHTVQQQCLEILGCIIERSTHPLQLCLRCIALLESILPPPTDSTILLAVQPMNPSVESSLCRFLTQFGTANDSIESVSLLCTQIEIINRQLARLPRLNSQQPLTIAQLKQLPLHQLETSECLALLWCLLFTVFVATNGCLSQQQQQHLASIASPAPPLTASPRNLMQSSLLRSIGFTVCTAQLCQLNLLCRLLQTHVNFLATDTGIESFGTLQHAISSLLHSTISSHGRSTLDPFRFISLEHILAVLLSLPQQVQQLCIQYLLSIDAASDTPPDRHSESQLSKISVITLANGCCCGLVLADELETLSSHFQVSIEDRHSIRIASCGINWFKTNQVLAARVHLPLFEFVASKVQLDQSESGIAIGAPLACVITDLASRVCVFSLRKYSLSFRNVTA